MKGWKKIHVTIVIDGRLSLKIMRLLYVSFFKVVWGGK